MRKTMITTVLLALWTAAVSQAAPRLVVKKVARNAVRIQYREDGVRDSLPDWLYVRHDEVEDCGLQVEKDDRRGTVTVRDRRGRVLFRATRHALEGGTATMAFETGDDEYLYGLGQFQDGYSNVRGLSRRLTQVNTQISLPMLLSSKGYGVLWNNYGLTEYNPCGHHVALRRLDGAEGEEVVSVTSTEGTRQEVRRRNRFAGTLEVSEAGDYRLLLDVGQKMARRHNLSIDGRTVVELRNVWLPPTASVMVHLEAGRHRLEAELSEGDQPVLYYDQVGQETVFRSPVAQGVDYTVFTGSADEVIATYRELTGQAPLMPAWALGYIHCRERYHSQDEILRTAQRFRREDLPLSVIVQDWQYWGKHGWNAMQFDEDYYPDPKALTDSLHRMGVRLMLSVWSKIDKGSAVGREMVRDGHYIAGTDWIDFFSPEAAAAYWRHFSERLLPLGIDAWWQDATEPENDDLAGRRVNRGRWSGEAVRNVYPLLVNKTVYEGLKAAGREPMILTRSGFPGIQRYGAALWSGDVGNDWETLRRQITAGLGVQAAGVPWWTYDAGGFFRPQDQYTDEAYIERMLRWIETAVYLPLMRVHGYMSNTEPWNYGAEAQRVIAACLKERERLRPYIERCARRVSEEGYTLMRPLVFDFADDEEALRQKYEYMFGPALLISPVTEPGVKEWRTYLPKSEGGWRDYRTGTHYDGGQTVTTRVDRSFIPVFVRESKAEELPYDVYRTLRTGKIENPMLWADVPDPDVIRVGDTFYMVSTTMHLMPGAPVMASKDLKNWETVGYVFDRLTDSPKYDLQGGTAYGRGQWATSLKYHKGRFYALLAPNERGSMGDTYIFTAERAEGPWTLVSRMRHFHDCSLFFDDDDRVYVVYGTGEMMELKEDLSDVKEGTHRRIFEREADERGLLEGSRMIKHNGRYYLLMISHTYAPGRHRREVCYRADSIQGPYEKQVILESDFGGFGHEAQGTIVDSEDGDWYGIIFQDRGGVGRVLTVMPCRWVNGWPMLGDEEGRVPKAVRAVVSGEEEKGIVRADDFGGERLGMHWQWNHNPVDEAWSLTERRGWLRLKTSRVVNTLFLAPNTLTQRMEGPQCTGSIVLDVSHMKDGDCAGLAAFNSDTGALVVRKQGRKTVLRMEEMSVRLSERDKEVTDVEEKAVESVELTGTRVWLRIDADFRPGEGGGRDAANFYYSEDGMTWTPLGTRDYRMRFDWQRFFMGTKFGIFCYATKKRGGWVDVDAFDYRKSAPGEDVFTVPLW